MAEKAEKRSEVAEKIMSEVMAMEFQEAKEAGSLGYMCRSLVQATMPHSSTKERSFTRQNGDFTLTMTALDPHYNLPFGSIPRLMMAWLSTEAVKTKERQIVLGSTLSEFMESIGLHRTGGKRGDITRFYKQSLALFNCAVSCSYTNKNLTAEIEGEKHQVGVRSNKLILVADSHQLWWEVDSNNLQTSLFQSTVTLSHNFFEEITQHPVPVDLRALKILKRSSMALDIYTWLTYRMYSLKRPTKIPWEGLELQFGSNFKYTRQFKKAFLEQLTNVKLVYPDVKANETPEGLLLYPSRTHVTLIKQEDLR